MSKPTYDPPRRNDRAITDEAWLKTMLHKTPYGTLGTIYRLDIERWSGKQRHAADDFPGAFDYEPFIG